MDDQALDGRAPDGRAPDGPVTVGQVTDGQVTDGQVTDGQVTDGQVTVGPSTLLLRPALELACAVARVGERLRPPVAAPGPLRPLVRFSRLPDRALDAVRQVVDDDDDFRRRVVVAADERSLGRLAWLWLARPDGWQEEIDSAATETEAAMRVEDDRRADRVARRRLGVVEASLRRTEAELGEERIRAAALVTELAQARQDRRAETESAARDRAAVLAATEARQSAERRMSESAARVIELEARLRSAEHRLAATEAANARLAGELDTTRRERTAVERRVGADETRGAAAAVALGGAVAEAASAAVQLGQALERAARILDVPVAPGAGRGGAEAPGGARRRPASESGAAATESGAGAKSDSRPAPAGAARRPPLRLPAAMLDDSPEAAAWLVRVPGVVVVVDGYNVTLAAWAGRDLADQRHRLVTALAELSMRSGAEVEVVFDGADDEAHPLRSMAPRRVVRVGWSPAGVDADEVIIERVRRLAPARPVVVATDDRRVRDETARAGANLLSTAQLVAVLGRSAQPGRP